MKLVLRPTTIRPYPIMKKLKLFSNREKAHSPQTKSRVVSTVLTINSLTLLLHLRSSSSSHSPPLLSFLLQSSKRNLTTIPSRTERERGRERETGRKMPILQFYTSPNQLTAEEKAELVKVITERYTLRLPAFFVNIMFNEVSLALFLFSSHQSSPITHQPSASLLSSL